MDLLGKRVQRCRSLPSVALRSFLNDTQVTQNATDHLNTTSCCCAHALLPVVGAAVKAGDEVKFLM